MNRSEQINELAAALAKAQAELRNPAFDSTNPHFKSKFASLAGVRDAITPVLVKHGLSVSQLPTNDHEGRPCVETMLMHSSGQWISSTLAVPVAKADAHGAGSAITYARRYSLMALVNVVGDEDDDGNAAVHGKGEPAKPAKKYDVPDERAKVIRRIADACIAKHAAGNEWGCYEEAASVTDPEERLMLWEFLKEHSKVRSSIKHHAELEKQNEKVPA